MSSLTSSLQPSISPYRIVGVGNAGVNFLDRLLVSNPFFSGLVAINNDLDALTSSVVPMQLALSPEQELLAALEQVMPQFETEIQGASVILLCAGLGGETASTLLPHLAAAAKKANKLTLACVTQPFSFEGKRPQSLAAEAASSLKQICDGVVFLDNNQVASSGASKAALGETFTASDEAMQVFLPNLLAMLSSKGPVRITRSHLLRALSRSGEKTYFGYGQASGSNRLHEAMERLFKTPQLQGGRVLAKSSAIFMQLRGPKDLSFAEAQAAMQEVERVVGEESDIQLSVSAEEPAGAALQIFILAVEEKSEKKENVPSVEKKATLVPKKIETPAPEPLLKVSSEELPLDLPELNLPEETVESQKIATAKSAAKVKQTQGALNFTAAQRGRFDKSEPTIVEGEDLDTPTYLRLGLKLS
jgi:cell division protein FtsZ